MKIIPFPARHVPASAPVSPSQASMPPAIPAPVYRPDPGAVLIAGLDALFARIEARQAQKAATPPPAARSKEEIEAEFLAHPASSPLARRHRRRLF